MHDVCRCRNPVRVNKVIEHMYSARPTLFTDTLTHVKLSPGEGTQREGDSSALTYIHTHLNRSYYPSVVGNKHNEMSDIAYRFTHSLDETDASSGDDDICVSVDLFCVLIQTRRVASSRLASPRSPLITLCARVTRVDHRFSQFSAVHYTCCCTTGPIHSNC